MWEHSVVRQFAKHPTSGTSLPAHLLDKLRGFRLSTIGMDTENYVSGIESAKMLWQMEYLL